ncbi:MAG: peptidase [Streptosporangiales bacterium]|nr:peptidase [Streptosporangiales bacterium]
MLSGWLLISAGPAFAAPPPTHAPGDVAAHVAAVTDAKQAKIQSYWTPERMESAIPLDRLVGKGQQRVQEVERGAPRLIPPEVSGLVDGLLDPQASGDPWTGDGAVSQTAGRVFFTTGGQDASCSGNSVNSANGDVVVTAGHCVKYEGEWSTNWAFVPGYDQGERPHGTWAARELLTTEQWNSNEDINHDVGMAVVEERDGQSLTQAVGGQGIAFNQDRGQQMYSFGYPAASPYDGESLIYCSGEVRNDPTGLSNDQGMTCDMTGGSSGGPWFINFDEATGEGVQNSVNSFKYIFDDSTMYGPYFGDSVEELYDRAQSS